MNINDHSLPLTLMFVIFMLAFAIMVFDYLDIKDEVWHFEKRIELLEKRNE